MKISILLAAAVAAVSLSACTGIPGTGGQDALVKLLMDPNCGHDDTVQFNAGILSGSATRHCPAPVAAVVSGPAAGPTPPTP